MSWIESRTDEEWKIETQKQWGNDPCCAVYAEGEEPGTVPFYDRVRKFRYTDYAPWMHEAIGFDRYNGKKLLEIGCGMGIDLMEFAKGGAAVTGIDLTREPLEIAGKGFESHSLKGEFHRMDSEKLEFPDGSFDVVYSFGVLHHTPNTQKAIDEVHRVLKPGGEAIVMLYYKNSIHYWWAQMFIHGVLRLKLFRMSPDELLSSNVEVSHSGAKPLVKVYNKKQARELFKNFSSTSLEVYQLQRYEIPLISSLLSDAQVESLSRKFGWFLLIKAVK
ncbi:MAG: class I SAM-dependent methyltransferase [Chloroflexi bacterium]|nr:class I SAM-dependent methyltransferase [Chloroflexota bacterium]